MRAAAAAIRDSRLATANAPLDPSAVLLLDDPVNERIVLTWALVPKPILEAQSLYDVASYSARVAGCEVDIAVARIHSLMGIGIIKRDGGVDATALALLRQRGAARVSGISGQNAETVAASFVARMDAATLSEFLNKNAPAARELSWADDDE